MKRTTHQRLGYTKDLIQTPNHTAQITCYGVLAIIQFIYHAHAERNSRRTRYTVQQIRYKTSNDPTRYNTLTHSVFLPPLPCSTNRLPPPIPSSISVSCLQSSTHSSPARTSFSKILTPSTKSSPSRTDLTFSISSNPSPVSSNSLSLSPSLPPEVSSSLLSPPLG